MLSRKWLHGFIIFDGCMIVLMTTVAWLGDAVSVGLVMAAVFAVGIQLWEVFRRRTPRQVPLPRPEADGQ